MRSKEFSLDPIVGVLHIGDYSVEIHQHSLDRARERNVNPTNVDAILKKISTAKAKLRALENGQSFWLHDNTTDTSLGIKTINKDQKIYRLKTAIPTRPQSTNIYPTVEVR